MLEFVNFSSTATGRKQAAVVFVHGFTGDVRKTWRRIPEFLQSMDRLRDWDLLGFGYRSQKLFDLVGLWSADAQLEEIATMLYSRPEIGVEQYATLTFVAHSMGGLVVQRALVKYKELRARTSHVVLFGTPSNGLKKANLFSFWKRQVLNMAAGKPFITQLRSDWKTLRLDTNAPFSFTAVAGEVDQFVPPDSSLAPFPESARRVIPGNHVTMLDAQSPDDPSVQIIMNALTKGTSLSESRSSVKVAVEMGKFQQVIANLWPDRDKAIATLPERLDDDAAVQLAIALEQTGNREDAIRILRAHKPSGTDVLGGLAGRLKRRWWVGRKSDDLLAARELYRSGYDQATRKDRPNHDQAYYHGINLAYLALAGERDIDGAREMAGQVLIHCAKAVDAGRRQWVLPTEGDALLILGRIADGLEQHRKAAKQTLKPWEAQSMEEQAVRVADLCGMAAEDISRLANYYEGGEG
jgi:pimeloyl-ACP methyl ester carboxylesterase